MDLKASTLARLGGTVAVPAYDRAALRGGIIHLGVGNFHRVHQAWYVDRCLHRPGNEAWGIVGVGVTDGATARRRAPRPRPSVPRTTSTPSRNLLPTGSAGPG